MQRTVSRAIDQPACTASSGADVLLVFLITMIYCLLSLLKTEAQAHFGVCVLRRMCKEGREGGGEGRGREGLMSWEDFHCAVGVGISLLAPTAALMPKGTQ